LKTTKTVIVGIDRRPEYRKDSDVLKHFTCNFCSCAQILAVFIFISIMSTKQNR